MKKLFFIAALVVSAMSGATQYVKVTDVNKLQSGDTIIWVNETDGMATGSFASSDKKIDAIAVTIQDSVVVAETPLKEIVLTKGTGNWTMKIGTTSLGVSSDGKDFKSSGTKTWTIDIVEGEALVKSTVSVNGIYPKIFYNKSSHIFRPYVSNTMAPIQIYRKLQTPAVPIAVEGVEMDYTELSLRAGETYTLTATVLPKDAKDQTVTWGSLDETIATVTDGQVTAVSKGQTKVWVKTNDGGFIDTCEVNVLASLEGQIVTWNQVQSLDSLKEGTRVFFAGDRDGENYIMGLYNYDVAKANIHGVEASFAENRHAVTANDAFAYTVHKVDDYYVFTDIDGDYLCDYSNKNLSAQPTLDNKAKWTVTMNKDWFWFSFENKYNTGYAIYCNYNSDLFCCYNGFDPSNCSRIVLYAENAPEWVEPVRVPELTIREYYSHDTITDALDFGKVEYDDSWGTETNPYVASKTLQFITKWQPEPIALSLYSGKVFALYTESIPVAGGTASIGFDTDTKGTYTDTLYVQTADTLIKIFLSAEAVDPEEILPKLTLSTRNLYLNPNLDNSNRDMAEMAFSVENLAKNLYIKWESTEPNTVPTWQGTELTLYAGNDLYDVYYGESTNMGTATRTDEPILLEVYTWQTGTFESNLCFYTFKEGSKTDYAFEERVHITIVVDEEYDPVGPTDFENARCTMHNAKLIRDGRLVIVRDGRGYDVLGREAERQRVE